MRAPGGEPALVTRLDQGQLWFSAGRRRSPWRHEVHVGPAIVSTPRGRFQAVAEPDGGATIACLAGRTRVVAGLREPVLLGPDQSAAVSSDGRTLVVMDRTSGAEVPEPDVIDLTDGAEADDAEAPPLAVAAAAATSAATAAAAGTVGTGGHLTTLPGFERGGHAPPPPPSETTPARAPRGPARLGWIPELVAVLALLGLLVAGVWVFTRPDDKPEISSSPPVTVPIESTTAAPTTTAPPTTTTTAAPTTTQPPRQATGAVGAGELTTCRRAEGGVLATVTVTNRSGPASTFHVSAALVDPDGVEFARAAADTALVPPGGTGTAKVLVPAQGVVQGSCELLDVTSG
ncbi:hypothetical protein [Aquihabitans sp. McL0605]|uniref:hypothetical protein n=1 Tax=Aquihabitans sp. McL0605 TaxID=3415671 RepID=UPI003CEC29EA